MRKPTGVTALQAKVKRKPKSKSKPRRIGDGGGLYLNETKNGTKSWLFMWKWKQDKTRQAMGLGSASTVSLKEAREKAHDARKLVDEGLDPRDVRKAAITAAKHAEITFGQVADEYFETHSPSWRSAKHHEQWTRTIKVHCKDIREIPVAEITTDHVLSVLETVKATAPVTAHRVRVRLEMVLNAAKAKGLRMGENPALWRGNLQYRMGAMPRDEKHHKAMPYAEVPAFMAKLRETESVVSPVLEFIILTAARAGEALNARWDEIDLDNAVWTIPAPRMKGGREHKVPLSPRCVTILQQMAKQRMSDFVFPGVKENQPVSHRAVWHLLKRLSDVTVHGFRSSFRDWCGDCTPFPRDIAEAALAHRVGDATEQAYRRGTAFEQRRALMEQWASYCEPTAGNVTAFRRRG
jgi:integrase